jgi:XTP/dITP diphosphohydrolase
MKVVIASHNLGKLGEFSALLAPLGLTLSDPGSLGIPAPQEDRTTFVENALDKARYVARASGLPALADDSGLVVPALGGAPGIRSARYAGENASDAENNALLIENLSRFEQPEAHYYCALVFVRAHDDPAPVIATGLWRGAIIAAPRGVHGFGYDPHFLVPEFNRTAAELTPDRKNRLSHRARALADLVAGLRESGDLPRRARPAAGA